MLRRAATRADVGACVVVIGLAGALLAVTTIQDRGLIDWRVDCQLNLRGIGWAFAACEAENNGFVPTWDDAGYEGPSDIVLSWADFLYDEGYLSSTRHQICPADAHPDPLTRERASAWGFKFVDEFGVGEMPRPGLRTSYAMNIVLGYNWPQDRYVPDPSRQLRAMDGTWTWVTCINARHLYAEVVLGRDVPFDYPAWYASMQAWRHGADFGANMLFVDGSVRRLTPIFPESPRDPTFDTEQAFTWLPGEGTTRYETEPYYGSHAEWWGRVPWLAGRGINLSLPEPLALNRRSAQDAWVRLPNPAERMSLNLGTREPGVGEGDTDVCETGLTPAASRADGVHESVDFPRR